MCSCPSGFYYLTIHLRLSLEYIEISISEVSGQGTQWDHFKDTESQIMTVKASLKKALDYFRKEDKWYTQLESPGSQRPDNSSFPNKMRCSVLENFFQR